MLLACSTASAHVTTIPRRCATAGAPRLCAIHWHRHRANHYRAMIGLRAIPYHWVAERYPARRARILRYWVTVQDRMRSRLTIARHSPWMSEPFHAQAMCIHRYESVDWHEPGSPGGGMQFMQGTWDAWGGAEYASTPGAASPSDQLRVAYRVVRHDGGWREWSTHSLCGL